MTHAALRFGLLNDAAPLVVAKELGYFAEEGLDVALSVEPSWANVADKLVYGLMDGAGMLPPLALAFGLGLRGGAGPKPLAVPFSISLNGNTITLAEPWASDVLADDAGGARTPSSSCARWCAGVMPSLAWGRR